jgi:transitional endoplasmic reticulum ATPase
MVAIARRLKHAHNRPTPVKAADTGAEHVDERPPLPPDPEEPEGDSPWLVVEKPDLTFDDIAGLEDVKEQIRIKMIYPFTHKEEAEKYNIRTGGGILLYGPPGTGKTMMAKAIAAELDAAFYAITPSDVLSKWVGDSEKNIQMLFDNAREQERAVIFIDEVEALIPARRDGEQSVMKRLVPQILNALDGLHREKDKGSLLFVGATNEPWSIDYAMLRPGRLDEKLYIDLPDLPARRRILEINLDNAAIAEDVDIDALANRLDGYSGADIAYVCRKVAENVFREAVTTDNARDIAMADFDEALARVRPSVREHDIARFDEYHTTS